MRVALFLMFTAGTATASAGFVTTNPAAVAAYRQSLGPGQIVEEDFTTSLTGPIVTGVLNSETPGLQPGEIEPGVTYLAPQGDGDFFSITDAVSFGVGALVGRFNGDEDRNLFILFDGAVQAFGFETGPDAGESFGVTLVFSDGTTSFEAFTGVTSRFEVGFLSSGRDIELAILDGNLAGNTDLAAFSVDNLWFASPADAAVPEPGTLGLLAVGAVGLLGGAYRRRKTITA